MSVATTINRIERMLHRSNAGDAAARIAYEQRASGYRGRPADYCREILNQYPTEDQEAIWQAAETYPYKVCVPSANNCGKTFSGAGYTSYFYDTYNPSVSLLTATTAVQVKDGLFKELRRLRPKYGFAPKDTRIESSPMHYAHGFTAVSPDAFQGRHEDNVLVIFDEATGIERDFWSRAGTMAQPIAGHAFLAFYNPNDASSYAYEAEDSGNYHVIRLCALTHLNVQRELRGLHPAIPSAIRLDNVWQRIRLECREIREADFDPIIDFWFPGVFSKELNSWLPGETSPVIGAPKCYRPNTPEFEAQVLGRWPLAASDALFSPLSLKLCRALRIEISPLWPVVVGCDVARFGDDHTCFAIRIGPCLVKVERASKRDTSWIAYRIRELLDEIATEYKSHEDRHEVARKARIYIDCTGGYGGGVADKLPDLSVVELNMASESPDPTKLRMRSYLWFRLSGIAHENLLDMSRVDERQFNELAKDMIVQRYRLDEQMRRVLEPKRITKQRLGRSPDAGDAVALSYYSGV